MKVTISEITLERLKVHSINDGVNFNEPSHGMVEIDINEDIAKRLQMFQDFDDTEPPDYDFLLNELIDYIESLQPKKPFN